MTPSFNLRGSLRALRQDIAPTRDLWAAIEPALESATVCRAMPAPDRSHAGHAPWFLAAGLAAMTVLAVGLVPAPNSREAATLAQRSAPAWQASDPRLEGAAIELAAAQMELRQALQQAPASVALQRLLLQTRQQQSRLQELERQAG